MSANETTFEIILEKLKKANLNTRSKGSMFEKLSKHLLKEKDTANIYKNIYLWDEWDKKNGQDCGIDLIIQTKDDDYIAVGILDKYSTRIKEKFQDLELIDEMQINEWCSFVYKNNKKG